MRVTSTRLQSKLDRINLRLRTTYEINNAPCYGGWQMTNAGGSFIVKHRVSPKEMDAFLDGMIQASSYGHRR